MLIVSGNLSFLNWMTILPSLMCFDDKSLAFLFSSSSAKKEVIRIQQLHKTGAAASKPTWGMCKLSVKTNVCSIVTKQLLFLKLLF